MGSMRVGSSFAGVLLRRVLASGGLRWGRSAVECWFSFSDIEENMAAVMAVCDWWLRGDGVVVRHWCCDVSERQDVDVRRPKSEERPPRLRFERMISSKRVTRGSFWDETHSRSPMNSVKAIP